MRGYCRNTIGNLLRTSFGRAIRSSELQFRVAVASCIGRRFLSSGARVKPHKRPQRNDKSATHLQGSCVTQCQPSILNFNFWVHLLSRIQSQPSNSCLGLVGRCACVLQRAFRKLVQFSTGHKHANHFGFDRRRYWQHGLGLTAAMEATQG